MALAQKRTSLDKCPHVTAQAKEALESAGQPPIRLVTVGAGERRLEMGNEMVMYRHEQKFYHPTGIGFLLEDTLGSGETASRVENIGALKFERVGLLLRPDLICVLNSSGNKDAFVGAISAAMNANLNLALCSRDPSIMEEGLKVCKDKIPLIIPYDNTSLDSFIKLAKDNKAPLAVTFATPEEASQLTQKIKAGGVEDIVLDIRNAGIRDTVEKFTAMRAAALKKNVRALGYPLMVSTLSGDPYGELGEAVTYVEKYASLVIVKNVEKEFVFPLLVARQDIYTDPQKPVQVEPKIYEIGKVSKDSPVLVTTNFSITYFTVAGEVESSKVPSYIICCDAEGMSVLTAWAAEKFTVEKISDTLKKSGIEAMVAHKNIVIPGYVSVMSGKLAEESGWKVSVGPREASGIPNYLRNFKA
jgi:acetyl-CoA decarbonylase/synthase complex subunit gamma